MRRLNYRGFAVFFVIFLILLNLTVVYGTTYEQLDYWYSDSNSIGKWYSTPSVGSNKLNSNSSFYFSIGNSHAKSQWNSAGISTSTTSNFSSADIQVYGGTYTELQNTGEFSSMSSTSTGICYYDSRSFKLFYEHESSVKSGYEMGACHIGIKDRGATLNEYKKTCTHEMGHSLGWFGHASGSTNIMYAYSSSYTSLTSVDKNHLSQIY